jgi:hypothetical protein
MKISQETMQSLVEEMLVKEISKYKPKIAEAVRLSASKYLSPSKIKHLVETEFEKMMEDSIGNYMTLKQESEFYSRISEAVLRYLRSKLK